MSYSIDLINQYPLSVRAASNTEETRIMTLTDWQLCVADFSGMDAI